MGTLVSYGCQKIIKQPSYGIFLKATFIRKWVAISKELCRKNLKNFRLWQADGSLHSPKFLQSNISNPAVGKVFFWSGLNKFFVNFFL